MVGGVGGCYRRQTTGRPDDEYMNKNVKDKCTFYFFFFVMMENLTGAGCAACSGDPLFLKVSFKNIDLYLHLHLGHLRKTKSNHICQMFSMSLIIQLNYPRRR